MKLVSTRIDEKDYDFLDTLAKNRSIRMSNIVRAAIHEFVISYTGEVTLDGLDRRLKLLRVDVDGLKLWATKTDGKIELLSKSLGGEKAA